MLDAVGNFDVGLGVFNNVVPLDDGTKVAVGFPKVGVLVGIIKVEVNACCVNQNSTVGISGLGVIEVSNHKKTNMLSIIVVIDQKCGNLLRTGFPVSFLTNLRVFLTGWLSFIEIRRSEILAISFSKRRNNIAAK